MRENLRSADFYTIRCAVLQNEASLVKFSFADQSSANKFQSKVLFLVFSKVVTSVSSTLAVTARKSDGNKSFCQLGQHSVLMTRPKRQTFREEALL